MYGAAYIGHASTTYLQITTLYFCEVLVIMPVLCYGLAQLLILTFVNFASNFSYVLALTTKMESLLTNISSFIYFFFTTSHIYLFTFSF